MCVKTIKIHNGNTSNEQLRMTPQRVVEADKGFTIVWKIQTGSNVAGIVAIRKKSGYDIWHDEPHAQSTPEGEIWVGTIKRSVPHYVDHEYLIRWVTASGGPYTHDPVISIRPTGLTDKIISYILIVLSVIFGFFSMRAFLRKKRSG